MTKSREEKLEYGRRWRAANVEKMRAYRAEYRRKNKDTLSVKRKEWCDKNRDHLKELKAEWYRNNIEKSTESSKRSALMRKYGITPAQRDAMFFEQGERCKICQTTSPNGKNWHVDHCHSTGKVRGILCNSCNLLLGYARDCSDVLRAAIGYLEYQK